MAKKRTAGQSDHEPVSGAAKAFGEKIRVRREALALTKYALSKRTGISAQGILLLESGRRETSWETVQLLSMVLEIPLEELRDPSLQPLDYTPTPKGRPRKAEARAEAEEGASKGPKKKGQ